MSDVPTDVEKGMPYSCSHCKRSFQKDYDLFYHLTDSKHPNCKTCLYCDYSFLMESKRDIKKHMKSKHLKFECGDCKKKFYLRDNLADHKEAVHRDGTSQPEASQSSGEKLALPNKNVPKQNK